MNQVETVCYKADDIHYPQSYDEMIQCDVTWNIQSVSIISAQCILPMLTFVYHISSFYAQTPGSVN